ncbi:hypothetical protein NPIL_537611 [Nephila pilipes]|uniref:Uncharacterized protein n=1 Tax=Nephila pilipes TaxID=299642 RepID=A0A8X6N675_NEPPI|nr:hypothetical protein NPIL_537611 [Nephila pilipes]
MESSAYGNKERPCCSTKFSGLRDRDEKQTNNMLFFKSNFQEKRRNNSLWKREKRKETLEEHRKEQYFLFLTEGDFLDKNTSAGL